MTTPGCDRQALVEAMFDGRLGPAEQASTERHLKSCPPCAELLRELTSMQQALRSPARPLSPLEHQRARLALLRKAVDPPSRSRRPAGLAAAALVMLPVAVWAATSSLSPLRALRSPPSPPSSASPAASSPSPGRLAPAAPAPSDAAPEVSSTLSPDTPAPVLSAGNFRQEMVDVAPASSTSSTSSTSSLPSRREAGEGAPAPGSPGAARQARAGHGAGDGAARASSASPAGASKEFAEAMRSLSQGDFGASASKLEGFAEAHPRDPRVEEAAYLSAIALERAGRLAEARAAARRYLAAYPEGAHRAQARRIAGE